MKVSVKQQWIAAGGQVPAQVVALGPPAPPIASKTKKVGVKQTWIASGGQLPVQAVRSASLTTRLKEAVDELVRARASVGIARKGEAELAPEIDPAWLQQRPLRPYGEAPPPKPGGLRVLEAWEPSWPSSVTTLEASADIGLLLGFEADRTTWIANPDMGMMSSVITRSFAQAWDGGTTGAPWDCNFHQLAARRVVPSPTTGWPIVFEKPIPWSTAMFKYPWAAINNAPGVFDMRLVDRQLQRLAAQGPRKRAVVQVTPYYKGRNSQYPEAWRVSHFPDKLLRDGIPSLPICIADNAGQWNIEDSQANWTWAANQNGWRLVPDEQSPQYRRAAGALVDELRKHLDRAGLSCGVIRTGFVGNTGEAYTGVYKEAYESASTRWKVPGSLLLSVQAQRAYARFVDLDPLTGDWDDLDARKAARMVAWLWVNYGRKLVIGGPLFSRIKEDPFEVLKTRYLGTLAPLYGRIVSGLGGRSPLGGRRRRFTVSFSHAPQSDVGDPDSSLHYVDATSRLGMGWEIGHFGSLDEMRADHARILALPALNEAWSRAPIVLEFGGEDGNRINKWRYAFTWALARRASLAYPKGLLTRLSPTVADYQSKTAYREEISEALFASRFMERVGYRLVPQMICVPKAFRIDAEREVYMVWENLGVAPCYEGIVAMRIAPVEGSPIVIPLCPAAWIGPTPHDPDDPTDTPSRALARAREALKALIGALPPPDGDPLGDWNLADEATFPLLGPELLARTGPREITATLRLPGDLPPGRAAFSIGVGHARFLPSRGSPEDEGTSGDAVPFLGHRLPSNVQFVADVRLGVKERAMEIGEELWYPLGEMVI